MATIFGFLAPALVLALLGLLAAGAVGVQRGRLTLALVVHAYAALVLGVCLVLALAGGALVVKVLAAATLGRDFSYQTADPPRTLPPGAPPFPGPDAAARAATQAADDLATGLTLLVVGGGLGAAHAIGKAAAARRDTAGAGPVERGYAVGMLAVGTAVGLVSGALLLHDLLRRYALTGAAAAPYDVPHPGGALGFALLFVPLWVAFARRVWRLLVGDGPQGSDSR